MTSLTSKVIGGGGWIGGLRISQRVIGFAKSIILARILAPDDFGRFAIATLVLTAFESLTQTGIDQAVIQRAEPDELYLQTAYWIKVVRGLLLACATYASAPLIASFFDSPDVVVIVRLLALHPALAGLESLGVALLQKELAFKRYTIFRFLGSIAVVSSSITLAILFQNAIALVCGLVIGAGVQAILSYFFHSFRPSFSFSFRHAGEIVDFGVWLLLVGILQYISLQGDDIALGRWANSQALGLYQMAFVVANIVAQEFSGVLRTLLLPAFSQIRESISRSREMLSRAYEVTAILVFPAAVGLAVLAPELATGVFGEQWRGMAPILPFLAASGVFRALSSIAHTYFIGIGKPKLMFPGDVLRATVLVLALYPCFQMFGTKGIAVAAALSTLAALILFTIQMHSLTDLGPKLVRRLVPLLIAAGLMGVVIWSLRFFIDAGDLFTLVLLVPAGAAIYLLLSYSFAKFLGVDIYSWLLLRLRTNNP